MASILLGDGERMFEFLYIENRVVKEALIIAKLQDEAEKIFFKTYGKLEILEVCLR